MLQLDQENDSVRENKTCYTEIFMEAVFNARNMSEVLGFNFDFIRQSLNVTVSHKLSSNSTKGKMALGT